MSFELAPLPQDGSSLAGLCTRQQVKERIGIKSGNTDDDARIDSLILTVPRVVAIRYGREFIPQVTETRTFAARSRMVNLKSYDLRAATELVLHPDDDNQKMLTGEDYVLWPIGADDLTSTYQMVRLADSLYLGSSFSRRFGAAKLSVAGDWGIWANETEVPADVNEAAVETILSWLDRPTSDIAAIDSSNPRAVLPGVAQTWDIPLSAHRKFSAYNRNLGVY